MAIRILKEVNREGGRAPATGALIIAGQPLELASASTVQPYSGVSGSLPLGLASDSNKTQPLQAANGLTVGVGFDYTNFDRGGLVGAFINGGEFELFDDSTGAPFMTGDTYTLNMPVYANSSGLVTSTAASNPRIGMVTAVTGSAPVTRLTIKLLDL
jgi:hypothetical protein